jgi:hypothetical protein
MIPKAAIALLPLLWLEAAALPEIPRHFFAGQVEQESCISLTHPKCWNPRATLKTSREFGVGLGQTTIAYRADGSVRFDNFEESRRKFRELKDWQGDRIYDPRLQMRALVLMDRECHRVALFAKNGLNRAAMTFVCYNSGKAGLIQDRQLCRNVDGCDPSLWFGHIEKNSLKQRTRVAGYGKSFFEISREYPKNVIFIRAPKYMEAA